jgi:D-alanyl-D-alanine dipeptidase
MLRLRRPLAAAIAILATTGCAATSTSAPSTTAGAATSPAASSVPAAVSGAATARAASSVPATTATTAASVPVPVASTPALTPSPTRSSTPNRPSRSTSSAVADPSAGSVGLIDVRTVVPDAIIDMRYATSDNFTGVRLYPADARCLVHSSLAPGLRVAAGRLRAQGLVLVFWDCYRPHAVQVKMYQVVSNPDWVAKPGPYSRSHETGRSVDITVARAATTGACASAQQTQGHCRLDMGTGFDDFTARAHAFATTGVTPAQQADRTVLRSAMTAGGLTVYTGEWWHFDGPGATVHYPIVNVPVD